MTTVWQQAGATLSLKNAIAEFNVTEEWLKEAKIPCQWRSFYGNSFPIFIRADVERVAREKLGSQYEISEARKALRSVNGQLSSLDAQRASLAERKQQLEAKLASLGAPLEEPPKPRAKPAGGKKGGGRTKAAAGAAGAAAAQPAKKRGRRAAGDDSDEDWRP